MPITNVFILSIATAPTLAEAVEQTARAAGVDLPAFGETIVGGSFIADDSTVTLVSDSLRAITIAAQTIASGEISLALAGAALAGEALLMALASISAVGAYNLDPLAQVIGYSLRDPAKLFASAELDPSQAQSILLEELPDWLASKQSRYALLENGKLALLLERV